ncbi:MAG TPA: aminotransferase class V-fold PLP-dependent enzyme [Thermomicrobiales bacterium]|nr:aminotransferase class V-fold PLP-dependent enzyme [Thermomicrobiales bacterium]
MAQAVDVQAFRDEFPVTEDWSYLNHAAYGPFPARTVTAVREWAEGFANAPTFFNADRQSIPGQTAELVAGLCGGRPDMVAWVGNLAEGMNLLANGLNCQPGDNVLIPVNEFPSVVYPFLNLTRRGVELRYVQKNAQGRTDPALIEAAMDDRTRALAISHVEYMDGFRNDLKVLGELCTSRGVELFVDVTQSLGAQPIDIEGSGITAAVAHGYKWLMSGFGIGVCVFASDAVERIDVTYAGRLSVNGGFESHEYALDWRDGAARYQTGGLNALGLTAMRASLSLVSEAGPEWIREHTLRLHDRLIEGVGDMGYIVASDLTPTHRSQILAFTSGDVARDGELVAELERSNVAVTLRGRGLRVSPYFYNNEDDVDRLLEALPPR